MEDQTLPAQGYLRIEQIAKHLNVCKGTVYKAIREGRFPSPVKFGRASRWDVALVREYLKQLK